MNGISITIKMALENTVLCRGANSAKESYEYADKMAMAIRESIVRELNTALADPRNLEANINKLISELKE